MSKIEHVIFLPCENTSFFRLFGWTDPLRHTYFNRKIDGTQVFAHENPRPFLGHDNNSNYRRYSHAAVNRDEKTGEARMDGFVAATEDFLDPEETMSYNPESSAPMMNYLASKYQRADRYFCSVLGDTVPNTMSMTLIRPITGVHFEELDADPSFVDEKKYDKHQLTLFECLNRNRISWMLASGDWPMQLHLHSQWTASNLARAGSHEDLWRSLEHGTLPKFTYLDAAYRYITSPAKLGYLTYYDTLLRDLYLNVKYSRYWDNTLIIVTFDEHGGDFDPVPVPKGLGVRVPAFFIAKNLEGAGITMKQFEHASLAKTVFETFGIEKEIVEKHYCDINSIQIPKEPPSVSSTDCLPDPPKDYFIQEENWRYKTTFEILKQTRKILRGAAGAWMYWKCRLNGEGEDCHQWV